MPAYATEANMLATIEGWTTDNLAALNRLLERASREVDRMVGPWTVETNGLKFGDLATGSNPKGLEQVQRDALARATCHQAYHMLTLDELDAVDPRASSVSGPDFSVSYREGAVAAVPSEAPSPSPKARDELRGFGLIIGTAGW
jgi:hypothetical protein